MRNSVVLIDTNILLNYITNREDPYLEQSAICGGRRPLMR